MKKLILLLTLILNTTKYIDSKKYTPDIKVITVEKIQYSAKLINLNSNDKEIVHIESKNILDLANILRKDLTKRKLELINQISENAKIINNTLNARLIYYIISAAKELHDLLAPKKKMETKPLIPTRGPHYAYPAQELRYDTESIINLQ